MRRVWSLINFCNSRRAESRSKLTLAGRLNSGREKFGAFGSRTFSGTPGFMANMSKWLGPPNWQRKITGFARALDRFAGVADSARSQPGSVKPSRPRPPT